jgi:hypothetical protein
VLAIPTHLLAELKLPSRKILELACAPTALPLFRSEEVDPNPFGASESYSIILALNQESMLIDPIQWEDFKKTLLGWAEKNCPNLMIPELTDNLFNERIPLSHSPRARQEPSFPQSDVYHFFIPTSEPRIETNHLFSQGIPRDYAKTIARINSHNRNLSMIGILPNQIRRLLKENNMNENVAFEELSREIFWGGYEIWKKRKRLMSNFWKTIAPKEWKLYNPNEKTNKGHKNKRKKKIEKKEYQCQNPFHFLRRHCDLSKKLRTPCSCSNILKRKSPYRFFDMTTFINNNSHTISIEPEMYSTREDHVRGAHDRGKKARHTS